MPRKPEIDKLEASDAGHTVERCQRALAAAPAGNRVYAIYWSQQLELAERRDAAEEVRRKEMEEG
jgi:hypothetical protein